MFVCLLSGMLCVSLLFGERSNGVALIFDPLCRGVASKMLLLFLALFYEIKASLNSEFTRH